LSWLEAANARLPSNLFGALPVTIDVQLLAESHLLADIPIEQLSALAEQSIARDMQRGDVLFYEGDEASFLYVVSEGRVAIANRSFDGRESVVALMEPGDLFGEMPMFDGQGRSAMARALETSQVITIPYEPLHQLYTANPQLLWGVVSLLAGRLRSMDSALADTMFLDVTGRTAKRLLDMAGEDDEFTLPVTQEELAGMVGASRERVNKSIAQFIKLGWMEQYRDGYRITNREQLTIRSR